MRGLSELTYDSGVGMGLADVVTDRLVNRIDWEPTWINLLTANKLHGVGRSGTSGACPTLPHR